MACARSFSQEFQKSYFFRVSDHVSQLLSSSPKDFGKKRLIVATLMLMKTQNKEMRHFQVQNTFLKHSLHFTANIKIFQKEK